MNLLSARCIIRLWHCSGIASLAHHDPPPPSRESTSRQQCLQQGHHIYRQIGDAILLHVVLIVDHNGRGKLTGELLDELLQRSQCVVVARLHLNREDIVGIGDGKFLYQRLSHDQLSQQTGIHSYWDTLKICILCKLFHPILHQNEYFFEAYFAPKQEF